MYNGYESQDAFHAAMREAWRERLSTPEGRDKHNADYGFGSRSHAGCDHYYGICGVTL